MRSAALAALLAFGAAATPAGADEFDRLAAIAGAWQGQTQGGKPLHVDYRLISRKSALVEAWQAGTPAETMTVFHRDGARVLATHYCAQGNQPRLALVSQAGGRFVFEYVDATNLADANAAHLVRLSLGLDAAGQLERVETYRENGKDASERVILHRPASG